MIIKSLIPILATAMDVPLIRATKQRLKNHFKYMILTIICQHKATEEHLKFDREVNVGHYMTEDEFDLHFTTIFNSDNIYHIGLSKLTMN